MKKQFADYETSNMLKELGFDEECFAYYTPDKNFYGGWRDGNIGYQNKAIAFFTAPLWQQVKKWLWERHGILFTVIRSKDNDINCSVETLKDILFVIYNTDNPIEAEIEGIKKYVLYLYSRILNEGKATNK